MEISSWQDELRQSVRDPGLLLEKLSIPAQSIESATASLSSFPVLVPLDYVERMRTRDPDDPLLLQVFPAVSEDYNHPEFLYDPVGDLQTQTVPGVLHKYHGRVLLVTTGACAIHCRYCFRQHFPYSEANAAQANWQAALNYIREDNSVREVILSGGDPLTLTDDKLQALFLQLEQIPHLKRLRIHTRTPVILPSRITDTLIKALSGNRLLPVVVLHCNHPNELSPKVIKALQKFKGSGITLLNQSVLLNKVNDHSDTLTELSELLFDSGVLPYYLSMMDKVQGAAHFVVSDARALEIMRDLRSQLPGYLVPKLVREVAGAPYKMPLL